MSGPESRGPETSGKVLIQFIEEGSAENPFAPRRWAFVPRVGDHVRLPETQRVYRVRGVEWVSVPRRDGRPDEDEPQVIIRVAD